MKLNLPTVTLMAVDCVDVNRAIAVVEHCKTFADFGAVKVLSHQSADYPVIPIMPLESLVAYSIWMLKECHKYIDTNHVLIVQRDGWIINPQAWQDEWLQYDYIAPLFNQYDVVGAGGFSLRSAELMRTVATLYPDWDGTQATADAMQRQVGMYEDGVIGFNQILRSRFNYAPIHVANQFAAGGNLNPANYVPQPFGFHGAYREIEFTTGLVEPAKQDTRLAHRLLNDELNRLINTYVKPDLP